MKLKYVTFISQYQAEHIIPRPDMALISITEPLRYENLIPKLHHEWKQMIKLQFHDVDTDTKSVRLVSDTDEFVVFDIFIAQQIIEFVEEIKDKVTSLIIHCYAGLSRSAAVSLFLSEVYGLNMAPGKTDIFNRTVYRILNDVYDQTYRMINEANGHNSPG